MRRSPGFPCPTNATTYRASRIPATGWGPRSRWREPGVARWRPLVSGGTRRTAAGCPPGRSTPGSRARTRGCAVCPGTAPDRPGSRACHGPTPSRNRAARPTPCAASAHAAGPSSRPLPGTHRNWNRVDPGHEPRPTPGRADPDSRHASSHVHDRGHGSAGLPPCGAGCRLRSAGPVCGAGPRFGGFRRRGPGVGRGRSRMGHGRGDARADPDSVAASARAGGTSA